MTRLEDLAPDELDQCAEHSPKGTRCHKQADHNGLHSFEEFVPVGPVIHCPFSAEHGNGAYGEGDW